MSSPSTLVAIVLTLAALSRTATAGDRKCYAGTDVQGKHTYALVAVREVDRAASEIRQHLWNSRNPSRDVAATYHVAADGKTVDVVLGHGRVRGHGTLEGKPWAWTAYHIEATAAGMTVIADGKMTGDTLVATSHVEAKGETISTSRIEARAFDCKELDRRRAALDDTAPGAIHTCYDGTLTDSFGRAPRRALLEQIVEPHRIKILRRIAGNHADTIELLAITGTSITRRDPEHEALTGTGTLRGQPGAWTGYAWRGQVPLLRHMPPAAVEAEGTLGGPHATASMTIHGTRDMTTTFHGDAFDCKDLDARRATLDAAAP